MSQQPSYTSHEAYLARRARKAWLMQCRVKPAQLAYEPSPAELAAWVQVVRAVLQADAQARKTAH